MQFINDEEGVTAVELAVAIISIGTAITLSGAAAFALYCLGVATGVF